MANSQGHIDLAMQAHVQGWAAIDGKPASPRVLVNGREVGRVIPNLTRPDLFAHGISPESGFSFGLAEPLSLDDTLAIIHDDGTHLGNSPTEMHKPRLRQLFSGIDFAAMEGLELGPLDRPLLSKRLAKVNYVDNADRNELVRKTSMDGQGTCIAELIREVDIIWYGKPFRDCIPRGKRYDFCLASHVIEHIPDMIGWLNEIASVLNEGGLVNLAIPHKVYTFDHRRQPTTASQFIGWHLVKAVRPRPEQVFDHVAYASPIGTNPPLSVEVALEAARRSVKNDDYIEVHCNVFTEASFAEAFSVICGAGLLPLKCGQLHLRLDNSNEFIVSLQKNETLSPADLAASYRAI